MPSDQLFTRTTHQGLQMHADQSVYRVTEYEFHDAGFKLADVRRLVDLAEKHVPKQHWNGERGPFRALLKEKNDAPK